MAQAYKAYGKQAFDSDMQEFHDMHLLSAVNNVQNVRPGI